MIQPSLDYLRTFIAVSRSGSFTSAAKMVGISQPAVSSQMQTLERQVGYQLFERHGRRIVPTARARDLASQIAVHMDFIEAATNSEESLLGAQPRTLHIAGPAEYLSVRVIPLLKELSRSNLEFRFTFGLPNQLLRQLSVGDFDLVVSSVLPRVSGVTSTPLMDEEFVLVASPEWRPEIRRETRLEHSDIQHIPVVAYSDNLAIVRRYWRTVFGQTTDGIRPVATIPDLRGVRDAVIGGLGMSVLPQYLVTEALEQNKLAVLIEPEMSPLNTLHIATQEGVLHKDRTVTAVQHTLLVDARRFTQGSHDEPRIVAT